MKAPPTAQQFADYSALVEAQPSAAWHRIEYRVSSAAASAFAYVPATQLRSLLVVEAEACRAAEAREAPADPEDPQDQRAEVFSIFGRRARAESRVSQS